MLTRTLSRLTILLAMILFLTPILLLAQEAADPEVVAEGTDWLNVVLGLLATNGLVILLGVWSLVQKTKLKDGATKVLSVLWDGADKAREVSEALQAVLRYLNDPTEANKVAAERECADLHIRKD